VGDDSYVSYFHKRVFNKKIRSGGFVIGKTIQYLYPYFNTLVSFSATYVYNSVMTTKNDNKTKKTTKSVAAFLNSIEDEKRRKDAKAVDKMLRDVTKKKPKMWGSAIVGYGDWHYKYASGREGDFLAIGFSPRKQALTLYVMPGYSDFSDLLKKLGPHKKGKSCLYIRHLDYIDTKVLKKILQKGWKEMQTKYGVK